MIIKFKAQASMLQHPTPSIPKLCLLVLILSVLASVTLSDTNISV